MESPPKPSKIESPAYAVFPARLAPAAMPNTSMCTRPASRIALTPRTPPGTCVAAASKMLSAAV